MYTCPPKPRHLSAAIDKFDYVLPYNNLVGGVFAIKTETYRKINGYSNQYWGWGAEGKFFLFDLNCLNRYKLWTLFKTC